MEKGKVKPIRLMCEIAMIATLGFIFDELGSVLFRGIFVNGGSISIAMMAVLVMAYRRGYLPALITGLIMGLLDLATGPYMVAAGPWQVFAQVLLDYIIAYPLAAFAGVFYRCFVQANGKKQKCTWIILGALLGGTLKFLSHFLSGIIFWADPATFAWPLDPLPYCFLYNLAYVLPSIVLSTALTCLLYCKAPQLFDTPESALGVEIAEQHRVNMKVVYIVTATIGLGLSIFTGIKYGTSFYYGNYGSDGSEVSFDKNYMVLFVLSIFVLVSSLLSLFVKKDMVKFYIFSMETITLASLVFALARTIKAYMGGSEVGLYWLWLILSLVLFGGFVVAFFLYTQKQKKPEVTQ